MKRLLAAILLLVPAVCFAGWPTTSIGGAGAAGAGGGGGGGSFTFIASASGFGDTPAATTVATSSTLNVASGDLLIALVTFEDGAGDEVISITDGGSNSFTFTTGDDVHASGNTANAYPLFLLSATANATATFTATLDQSRPYRRIDVMQYRPSGGTTSKDISGTREASGTGTSIASGTFSTTGTNGVACGMTAVYTSGTHSSQQVGGVAADNAVSQNGASIWCRILSAALTTQTATTTYSGSNDWAATAISFKSE